MKNTGVLFANDVNKDRAKAIVGNFHRLGIINSIVCSYDGRKITKVIITLVQKTTKIAFELPVYLIYLSLLFDYRS